MPRQASYKIAEQHTKREHKAKVYDGKKPASLWQETPLQDGVEIDILFAPMNQLHDQDSRAEPQS